MPRTVVRPISSPAAIIASNSPSASGYCATSGTRSLQQLLAGVAEQLAGGRVGGHVPHLVVGDQDRDGRVLDRLAEEDALDEGLGGAHAMNLARTTTIA